MTQRGRTAVKWSTVAAIATIAGVVGTWGYSVAEAKFSTRAATEEAINAKTRPMWEALKDRPTRDEIKPQLDAIKEAQREMGTDIKTLLRGSGK